MKNSVLVCVTQQESCARLIKAGAVLAKEQDLELEILSVFPSKSCFTPDFKILDSLQKCSMENNAQMTVFYDDHPFIVAAAFAKKCRATHIITGFSGDGDSPFISGLHIVLPEVTICMVNNDNQIFHIIPNKLHHVV